MVKVAPKPSLANDTFEGRVISAKLGPTTSAQWVKSRAWENPREPVALRICVLIKPAAWTNPRVLLRRIGYLDFPLMRATLRLNTGRREG